MQEAIGAYRSVVVSSEFKELERLRAKARHDEAQARYFERQEGIHEGMQRGMQAGRLEGILEGRIEIARSLLDILDTATIAAKTGLSLEEVTRLKG